MTTTKLWNRNFSLVIGFLGEILDYRWCITIGGTFTLLAGFVLILVRQKEVRRLYEPDNGGKR